LGGGGGSIPRLQEKIATQTATQRRAGMRTHLPEVIGAAVDAATLNDLADKWERKRQPD